MKGNDYSNYKNVRMLLLQVHWIVQENSLSCQHVELLSQLVQAAKYQWFTTGGSDIFGHFDVMFSSINIITSKQCIGEL